MKRYRRIKLVQSAELWGRWMKGKGLNFIGRVFGRTSSCIFNHKAAITATLSAGVDSWDDHRRRLAGKLVAMANLDATALLQPTCTLMRPIAEVEALPVNEIGRDLPDFR